MSPCIFGNFPGLIPDPGDQLAAVIIEPILGAGGNIPADRKFLQMLRQKTTEFGILLIFDEIKTARLGSAGVGVVEGEIVAADGGC